MDLDPGLDTYFHLVDIDGPFVMAVCAAALAGWMLGNLAEPGLLALRARTSADPEHKPWWWATLRRLIPWSASFAVALSMLPLEPGLLAGMVSCVFGHQIHKRIAARL